MVVTRSGVSDGNAEIVTTEIITTESIANDSINVSNLPLDLTESETLVEMISRMEKLLEANKINFNVELKKLSSEIVNLQTRIIYLEEKSSFIQHTIKLHKRKLDDNEQYSRKVNLTIDGIEVGEGDSPKIILQIIKDRVKALHLDIRDWEFDRAHRIGKKYMKKGKTYQKVILRLCSWRCRNEIYINRKQLHFFVSADLTDARQKTLDFARNQLEIDPSAKRVIDYIFVDDNCKLKLKSNSKKYFAFSTMDEFLCLVSWLDINIIQSEEVAVGDYINRKYI